MPTYEYECRSCSHTFEAFQTMSEAPLSDCPSCGGAVRRLIGGGTGIIFKGSGFYVNDSRKSGTGRAASPAADAAKKEAPSTTAGGDSAAPAPSKEGPKASPPAAAPAGEA
jgi:putative FmdB family regulatory protein